jgi:hypothetical protein
MADAFEQFNQHQIDTRNRLNFLVQSVLLLAGGALTASIAVFTGSRSIQLEDRLALTLGCSWWALVMSICLAVLVVAIVVLRDYWFGEQWRKQLNDPSAMANDSPGFADLTIIIFGVLSLLSFLGGFIGIAYVATQVVVA